MKTMEKSRWELHKYAMYNFVQILEAAPLSSHLPPISQPIQVKRRRYAGHCSRGKDGHKSDIQLLIPTNGSTSVG